MKDLDERYMNSYEWYKLLKSVFFRGNKGLLS
jgi:hypothetical protein